MYSYILHYETYSDLLRAEKRKFTVYIEGDGATLELLAVNFGTDLVW